MGTDNQPFFQKEHSLLLLYGSPYGTALLRDKVAENLSISISIHDVRPSVRHIKLMDRLGRALEVGVGDWNADNNNNNKVCKEFSSVSNNFNELKYGLSTQSSNLELLRIVFSVHFVVGSLFGLGCAYLSSFCGRVRSTQQKMLSQFISVKIIYENRS
jgi:hypothetical protein